MWRIRNLYFIMDKDGKVIKFSPNEAQEKFLSELWNRNLILKARQRGFSTLIQLLMLDQAAFNPNIRAGVVAQNKDAATTIFRDKIRFAYDRLPPMILEELTLTTDSAQELVMSNNSSVRVGTSLRSGTLQYLHVSEFGKICAEYPAKAREIITGTIPTVNAGGFVFIESTAEGQEGYFYEMCQRALSIQQEGRELGQEDYRFHFFGWWDAAEYSIETSSAPILAKDVEYFEKIEAKIGRKIDEGHRRWYVAKRDIGFHGDWQMMKQEYPSIPEEAFEQSHEGCYYTQQMTAARVSKRIGFYPWIPGIPVNTFWDIGNSDGTAIWFHQNIRGENRFIRFYENWGEDYPYYVAEMQKYRYVWGVHHLPHDADHIRQGMRGKSAKGQLEELGLANLKIIPAPPRTIQGINAARSIFPTCTFDATNCAAGIKHLDLYTKTWDTKLSRWKDEPRHDCHSEAADAFRQFAQGYVYKKFIEERYQQQQTAYSEYEMM